MQDKPYSNRNGKNTDTPGTDQIQTPPSAPARDDSTATAALTPPAAPLLSAAQNRESANTKRFSRNALLVFLIVTGVLCFPIMRLFVVPLIVAATFTALFFPLYHLLMRLFGNRKTLSSLACCFLIFIGLMIPMYVMVHIVTVQSIDFYRNVGPTLSGFVKGDHWAIKDPRWSGMVKWLQLIDWPKIVQEGLSSVGKISAVIINRTSAGFMSLFFNLFIILFTMFFFFIDGHALVKRIRYLSPLKTKYEDLIINRFLLISRASIKGVLVIGLIQSSLAATTLLIFGVKSWLLWGFVMIIVSVVPMMGAYLIMIPAGIIQFALGNFWQGIGILAVQFLVISTVDNFIRPRLVGGSAHMHPLLILLSTLGGLSLFGVMGFIVGPAMASFFMAILDIYSMEFKEQLEELEEA